jgi:MFS family permease
VSFFDEPGRSHRAGRASASRPISGDGFDHEEPHGFAGDELAVCKRRRGTRLDAVAGALPLLAVGIMLVASHFADRSGHRKAFVWPFLVVGAVAFGGSHLLGVSSFWPAFVLLVITDGAMYAPYGPSSPGFPTGCRARRRRVRSP